MVVTDGAARPLGMPRCVSTRYLAYTAALSEVPRATIDSQRGPARRTAAAACWARSRPSARSASTAPGISPISPRITVAAGSGMAVAASGAGIGDGWIEAWQVLAVGLQERRQQWLGRCAAVDERVRAQRLECRGPVT